MEGQSLAIYLWYVLHILPVVLAHHYVGDSGTLGGKDFLLYSSHGQHLSSQGYLTCHGHALAHLALGEGRGERSGNGDTSRWTVLGRCAFGHMDMYVPVVKDAVVDTECLVV